jgi:23S rRNA (adenine1618-N6)-methyltransferase
LQLGNADISEVGKQVDVTLSGLPLKWMWKAGISTGVGFTDKAVWSRASRRRASKGQDASGEEGTAIGFKIHVHVGEAVGQGTKVTILWLKGHDSVLFESFCGMVKRKLQEAK